MDRSFDAIFEHGVLKPLDAINLVDGEQVRVSVESKNGLSGAEVSDSDQRLLLDTEFHEYVAQHTGAAISHEELRDKLAVIPGNLSDLVTEERGER